MIRSAERIEYEEKITEIEGDVYKVIDAICEKYDNTITYAQINSALLNVMKGNFRHVTNFEIKNQEGINEEE